MTTSNELATGVELFLNHPSRFEYARRNVCVDERVSTLERVHMPRLHVSWARVVSAAAEGA